MVGVALFVAADLTYQSAIVFYNALLPVVAAGRGAGRISGYGTAAGYVGTILALIFLTFFVSDAETVRSVLGPSAAGWRPAANRTPTPSCRRPPLPPVQPARLLPRA